MANDSLRASSHPISRGVIERRRTHRLSLDTRGLGEAADRMDRQRARSGRLFDVVDEYLEEGMRQ